MKFATLLCSFWGTLAFATVANPTQIQKQLETATLVADVQVESLESFQDPDFDVKSHATARILAVYSALDDGGRFPQVGDSIVIETLGGEIGELGVLYAGLPRPYTGRRYRASLQRLDGNLFRVVGMEAGLKPLDRQRGFSRNRTDGSNGAGSGPYLYWDSSYFPIPYYISLPTFQNQPDLVAAIDLSFRPWRDPGEVQVEFMPMGCTSTTLNRNDGINTVIFVTQHWLFDPVAIAITRNFYVSGSGARAGQILDTDIMINAVNHSFTTTGDPTKNDMRNIVTHEVGHFIGMGHEVDPKDHQATMYETAVPGETGKRALHSNDYNGLYSAYAGVGHKLPLYTSADACALGFQKISCLSTHASKNRPAFLGWVGLVVTAALGLGRLWVRKQA